MSNLEQNIRDIVTCAIEHDSATKEALLVFDTDSTLARMVTNAYKQTLPHATCVNFHHASPEDIIARINTLAPKSLVVLIQSTSFRLNKFRFRLELFNRDLAVIEHPHLGRMPESEWETYMDALAYDADYYRTVGPKLKTRIDNAQQIIVRCPNAELLYNTPFEEARLNIGDYRKMKNIGGQFPIGEVFTEAVDFSGVNGTVQLYAFGNQQSRVVVPEKPVLVVIKEGLIVDTPGAPTSFTAILDLIREDEPLWVRELGFGLNRALTRTRMLEDVGSYERMCGVHLSLGQKHTIYGKPGFPKRKSKYHVDVFVDVTTVEVDGVVIYRDGAYQV
ncbi:TPA: hypothetical protein DEB00_01870 [Candidatus Uhrbacteria bacterium]|nr:hypothetical protein [Candidatus Uhrbacteria bacterium]